MILSIHFRFIICFLMVAFSAKAEVKLPAIFNDGMVLQQNSNVAIWGWANPGEKITIRGGWNQKPASTVADRSGKWSAFLQTSSYGGPFEIIIKAENTITLKDVLIGEVWLCSGQSNMGFPLKLSENSETEIENANFPQVRYFDVKRKISSEPLNDMPGSFWQQTSPQTASAFSAVGYYFAKKIHRELKVPVGIIFSAWGGSPAEAWTPSTTLSKIKGLDWYLNRWKDMMKTVEEDSILYNQKMEVWKSSRSSPDSNKYQRPKEPQTLFLFNRPWKWPFVLYNGMINPLIPFTIKGVLWYQGEANVYNDEDYYLLFSSMIDSWRGEWKSELPFYFVQIAPFGYSNMEGAARLREAQYKVSQSIVNTVMVATADIGNMKDQHPVKKEEVGNRLASVALSRDYGKKGIIYKGPEVKSSIARDGKVYIRFNQKILLKSGQIPEGFEIGYKPTGSDDLKFVNANARLSNDGVTVWSEKVDNPVAVRYAWVLAGDGNLMNDSSLPAYPFSVNVK